MPLFCKGLSKPPASGSDLFPSLYGDDMARGWTVLSTGAKRKRWMGLMRTSRTIQGGRFVCRCCR